MIAVDTNVLARYLLADDALQARAAGALLAQPEETFWIPVTVLLELGWVLRRYGVPRDIIVAHLRDLMSLPGVDVQMAAEVIVALSWAEGGLDFADALQLALSARAQSFATFDEELALRARKLRARPSASSPLRARSRQ